MQSSIVYKVNPRAKRISLRVDSANRQIIAVMPNKKFTKAAEKFVQTQREWIEHKISQFPQITPFQIGTVLNLIDEPVELVHVANSKTHFRECDSITQLAISGPKEMFPIRARRAIVDFAKREYLVRIEEQVAQGCLRPHKVRVNDAKSRWGSCSANGTISLSWRLVLAPMPIMNYVIIHELCHLRHLDHSERYWQEVEKFDKKYKEHRLWLNKNGSKLQSFG